MGTIKRKITDYKTENIPLNYYPITSFLSMTNTADGKNVTIYNSQSQGGTIQNNNTIELMHTRRHVRTDSIS